MRNLSNKLTVFVIAVEKGKNYDACLKALSEQTVKFKLEKIEDYYPMSKAFNEMLTRCETPYFIQCDEDMILKNDAVETMYDIAKNSPSNIVTLLFYLFDVHLNSLVRGVRICKHEILKNYPFKNVLACEREQKDDLFEDGYGISRINKTVGTHSPYWTNLSIFHRYFSFGERYKMFSNSHKEIFEKLWKILKNNPSELNLYALLGAFASLFSNRIISKEKNYLKYKTKKFEIIEKVLNTKKEGTKIQFICPDYRHPYLLKLANYLDIEMQRDLKKVEKSNKALILWNLYGHLKTHKKSWKLDMVNYFKERNKPTYVVERGALPETIMIDKNGFLVESSSYNEKNWNHPLSKTELEEVDNYIADFTNDGESLEKQNNNRISKQDFYERLNIDKESIKIFVPMQNYDDTVITLWSDWVKSLENFQDIIRTLANKNKDVVFLVKNHPTEETVIMKGKNNIKIVDDFHYKDCLKYSDTVLTINSGVGLQAMMWQKPVILVGKSFYQFKGINYKANNIKDINDLIYDIKKPSMYKVKRFIYFLKFKFYTHCIMEQISKGRSRAVEIGQINFEHPFNNQFLSLNYEGIEERTFSDFINCLSDFCLFETTCLDAIRFNRLEIDKENIYIGTKLNPNIINDLLKKGYDYDKDNHKFIKNNINIHVRNMPASDLTKVMSLYNTDAKVPFPVISYLIKLYGKDWRSYGIKK